jgi:exonuclease SbcD
VVRILHTSDWHLGRSFHGVRLEAAQAAYVDHLVELVRAERVDLVLVSGDVYDRALPPVSAVEQADEAFARLAASGARTVVTSGNHDSQIRLGFNHRLVDVAGVHLRTRWQDIGTPVLVDDEHGPVAVYGLPYLEPDAVLTSWALPARSHEAALAEAMARVRADLETRPPGTRSVVMAHAFVAGSAQAAPGMASASERDISVGGIQIAPTSLFTGVTYTALGHLHGAQTLTETVRYSGSPLAYSFSEAGHVKGSWLVELDAAGVVDAQFVAAPVPRPLGSLTGSLDHLLTDPSYSNLEDHWLEVRLTDRVRPTHAMERLRTRFPHTLLVALDASRPPAPRPSLPRVERSSDYDIALGFVAEVREVEATTEEALLLQMACECARQDGDADPLPGRAVGQ